MERSNTNAIVSSPDRVAVIVPAWNESACIAAVVAEIKQHLPACDVVVIDDGSADHTAAAARSAGAIVLELPCNLGVGGAVQAGFRYAWEQGYSCVIRCDGDGQHMPEEMPILLDALREHPVDLVIGSRYLSVKSYRSTPFRYLGILGLSGMLSVICRQRITDPTSGFQALGRELLYFFARQYPSDYPEPEAVALLRRQGYALMEVPVRFRRRETGTSSIGNWSTFYFIIKVFLALVVGRAKPVDPRYARANVARLI